MSNKTSAASGGGVSLMTVLFLIFLVLKLCGLITWSWWWVTAPLWGGFALILAGFLIWMIAVGIAAIITAIISK